MPASDSPTNNTTLTPHASLAIAILCFFAPALLLSLYIFACHRQRLWTYAIVLAICRIISASTTIYIETTHTYTTSLIECAAITAAIGTAPLLLTLMGFLQRIHVGDKAKAIWFRMIQVMALVALVLAIVGGVKEDSGSRKAASILFLAIFLTLAGTVAYTVVNRRAVPESEGFLLKAAVLALPFLLVRIIYTVASGFASAGSVFYWRGTNVYVEAFMQFAMEAIVVCLYTAAGFLTPKAVPQAVEDVEGQKLRAPSDGHTAPLAGMEGPPKTQRPQRQARSLGDYRPRRLIMTAIRDRR